MNINFVWGIEYHVKIYIQIITHKLKDHQHPHMSFKI